MHQQVRTKTTKTGSRSPGPGAAYDDSGSLVDILEILVERGVNLQTAGGHDLDEDGEFVFAVHHDDEDDRPGEEAAGFLREAGYPARTAKAHVCPVEDEPGGLLGCIKKVGLSGQSVYEIFVGTPDAEGKIPVQLSIREPRKREAAG